jgi:hypothetical protein
VNIAEMMHGEPSAAEYSPIVAIQIEPSEG